MARERPLGPREPVWDKHGLSGSLSDDFLQKSHDFMGVAPYLPFSPSTASRGWVRCCKTKRSKRIGVCHGVTNIGSNV